MKNPVGISMRALALLLLLSSATIIAGSVDQATMETLATRQAVSKKLIDGLTEQLIQSAENIRAISINRTISITRPYVDKTQLDSLKYSHDQPSVASTAGTKKRLLLVPQKSDNPIAQWTSIRSLHVSQSARTVRTLKKLRDIQIVEIPAYQFDSAMSNYRGSGLFKSVEEDQQAFDATPSDDGRNTVMKRGVGRAAGPDVLMTYDPLNYVRYNLGPTANACVTYAWHLYNTGEPIKLYSWNGSVWVYQSQESATAGACLHVLEAWDQFNVYGADSKIAVIDSGISYNHEDLVGHLKTDQYGNVLCFAANSRSGQLIVSSNLVTDISDAGTHGTEMSGLIAATYGNGS